MAGGGIDYLADNTLVFVIILIILLVLIISAIIAWQSYRLCGRYCKSDKQCAKKLSPCVQSEVYSEESSDDEVFNFESRGHLIASYEPPRNESDCSQRTSEYGRGRPGGITSVHTDDLSEDDVSCDMSIPPIPTPPVPPPLLRYRRISVRNIPMAPRVTSSSSYFNSICSRGRSYDAASPSDGVETRESDTITNIPNELVTTYSHHNLSLPTPLSDLSVRHQPASSPLDSISLQSLVYNRQRAPSVAFAPSGSTSSSIERLYVEDAPTPRVGAETRESETGTNILNELDTIYVGSRFRDRSSTTLVSTWSGTANDDTLSAESDHQLTDSNLQELMVPDMNESVVKEVRSKPIMFISRRIDEKGGTLVLDNMGIFLTVPPGAIEPGKPEIIFLALTWDLKDLPRMTPNQTIVSPVVQVGPHGLKLKRQATLSFGHCAFNANQVKVYSSETHLMQDKKWSATVGEEEGGTSSHRVLNKECQVYLSHFTLFTCIAEGEAVKKWLQVAAFGKMIGSQFEIRVYLLNDTPSALQFAVENQKKFHFRQMKSPQEYLFCDDMTNMILKVESISEGWSSNVEEMQEEIPFLSIWHGKSPFASFVFKMLNRETEEINTTISARQGDGYKLQLKLLKEIRQKRREDTVSRDESVENRDHVSITSSKRLGSVQGLVSEDYFPQCSHAARPMAPPAPSGEETTTVSQVCCALTSSPNSTHVIPHGLKMRLVELMDPLKAAGNDWRMIASELGVDSKIDFLGMQNSPFLEVLVIMQGLKKDLRWLEETLMKHQRKDAADVIKQYLEINGNDSLKLTARNRKF